MANEWLLPAFGRKVSNDQNEDAVQTVRFGASNRQLPAKADVLTQAAEGFELGGQLPEIVVGSWDFAVVPWRCVERQAFTQ